jgi:hypothetical protein
VDGLSNIVRMIMSKRMRWEGYGAHMTEKRKYLYDFGGKAR